MSDGWQSVLPCEEGDQVSSAQVVKQPGAHDDVGGLIELQRVRYEEGAVQPFSMRKAGGFGDQRCVEVAAHQLNRSDRAVP